MSDGSGEATPTHSLFYVGLAVIALMAFLVGASVAMALLAPVTMPNVVGLSGDDAVEVLDEAGVDVGELDPAGTVVDQEPDAGEQWHPGDEVTVVCTDGQSLRTFDSE